MQPFHADDCLPPPAVLNGESTDTCDNMTQPSAVFATTFLLPAAVQLSPAVDEPDPSTTLATESVTAAAAAESDCLQTFAIADKSSTNVFLPRNLATKNREWLLVNRSQR
jgi:hypothetical protein